MNCSEAGGLGGRLRGLLAGCDEADPRFPMYATFLKDLHVALRHSAGAEADTVARAVERWARRGLAEELLCRLAATLVGREPEKSRGTRR